MADEMTTEDVFMAHMENAVRRSQEIWPDDWRNHHTFYDGEVARLLDTLRQAADEPRAIVRAFALAMERKLAANEHKPGWKQDSPFDLLRRLREEVAELVDAVNDLTHVHMGQSSLTVPETTTAILCESADVANFALFVADVCGALPATDARGR